MLFIIVISSNFSDDLNLLWKSVERDVVSTEVPNCEVKGGKITNHRSTSPNTTSSVPVKRTGMVLVRNKDVNSKTDPLYFKGNILAKERSCQKAERITLKKQQTAIFYSFRLEVSEMYKYINAVWQENNLECARNSSQVTWNPPPFPRVFTSGWVYLCVCVPQWFDLHIH